MRPTRIPGGKRTSTAPARTSGGEEGPPHSTDDQPREPRTYAEAMARHFAASEAPPAPLDALREKLATLDALSDLAARTVEDAASDNPVTRRRHARLVGMIAECAAAAYESSLCLR